MLLAYDLGCCVRQVVDGNSIACRLGSCLLPILYFMRMLSLGRLWLQGFAIHIFFEDKNRQVVKLSHFLPPFLPAFFPLLACARTHEHFDPL